MTSLQNKMRMNELAFLPVDIIINILLWLPAEFLYKYGRLVCKQWARIIGKPSFVESHLKKSRSGLLIQFFERRHSIFLEMKYGGFVMTHIRQHFRILLQDSCRGLCLFCGSYSNKSLYVQNPITGQTVKLPSCCEIENENHLFSHLVYIPQDKEYKVIRMCCAFDNYNWRVLTLGRDVAWRKLGSVPTTGFEDKCTSASVGEVIYVAQSKSTILAIDLRMESTCYFKVPNGFIDQDYSLLSMQDSLTCAVTWKDDVCIWLLDFYKGEWTKVCEIKHLCKRIKMLRHDIWVIGWLDNSHIIFKMKKLERSKKCPVVAYNVKTGEASIFGGKDGIDAHICRIHTNSLVSW